MRRHAVKTGRGWRELARAIAGAPRQTEPVTAEARRAARYLESQGWRRHQAHHWRRPGDPDFYSLAGALQAQAHSEDCDNLEFTSESEPTRRAPENRPPGRPA
jgi:hypothetical protein